MFSAKIWKSKLYLAPEWACQHGIVLAKNWARKFRLGKIVVKIWHFWVISFNKIIFLFLLIILGNKLCLVFKLRSQERFELTKWRLENSKLEKFLPWACNFESLFSTGINSLLVGVWFTTGCHGGWPGGLQWCGPTPTIKKFQILVMWQFEVAQIK